MPWKVKATCVKILGNTERYPCQFGHQVGDEVIFDGDTMIGRMCPDLLLLAYPHVHRMHYMGPRYRDTRHYAVWLYQGGKRIDPSMKKYDGIGFKPVLEPYNEPQYHMAYASPQWGFPGTGPKAQKRVDLPVMVRCPDAAVFVTFKFEAFALVDIGRGLPYYRRQMSIMDKVKAKPGIPVNKILDEFTKWEREEIYPPLMGNAMVETLLEELELAGYAEVRGRKAYVLKDLPPR